MGLKLLSHIIAFHNELNEVKLYDIPKDTLIHSGIVSITVQPLEIYFNNPTVRTPAFIFIDKNIRGKDGCLLPKCKTTTAFMYFNDKQKLHRDEIDSYGCQLPAIIDFAYINIANTNINIHNKLRSYCNISRSYYLCGQLYNTSIYGDKLCPAKTISSYLIWYPDPASEIQNRDAGSDYMIPVVNNYDGSLGRVYPILAYEKSKIIYLKRSIALKIYEEDG
jgi:hypothetical protein